MTPEIDRQRVILSVRPEHYYTRRRRHLDLFPYDPAQIIRRGLSSMIRPADGLLHPSGDLVSPLRHVQLKMAGAPMKERGLAEEMSLLIGTLLHRWLGEQIEAQGLPVMCEVNMTPWLPEGWGGTLDYLVWHPGYEAFVIWDLKTTKGEAMTYLMQGGIKQEHIWQTSAYYWAGVDMGIPIVKGIGVVYLPKNDASGFQDDPAWKLGVLALEGNPIPLLTVYDEMERRRERVDEYVTSLLGGNFLNDSIEPPQERVQRLFRNKDKYELKLVPHWTARFCPFDNTLCDCSTQGTTKIGEYVEDEYKPRKGYEDIEPEIAP